jgi:hypothetical protein
MVRKAAVAALTFWLVASSAPARAYAGMRTLESYDWSASHVPSLATNPPPRRIVEAFQKEQYGDAAHLCSFRFVDLGHSGFLSLVTTFDDGEVRMFRCQAVYIFDKTPTGFRPSFYDLGSVNGLDVNRGMIRDLRGDGKLELIVDHDLTSYLPSQGCVATWPVIYRREGNDYVNASVDFKEFYRQTIESLNQRIAAMSSGGPASAGAGDLDCLEMELAKCQRLLGAPPDAGLKDAIEWSRSTDPIRRRRAVDVLGDIGSPEAIRYLRMLATDPNRDVVNYAQLALSRLGLRQ